jgi:hypothetical protein
MLLRSTPEVGTLVSNQFSQYLHLTVVQVSPEKFLSVSAATHHVMQLLLVKSWLAPSCRVFDSSTSAKVHISSRLTSSPGFGFPGLTLRDTSVEREGACPGMYSPTIMPRDGANMLSDVRAPVPTVVCDPCGRRERYDVERLTRQYGGDVKLTDLLPALVADCPKRGSVSVNERCKAVFEKRR